MKEQYVGDVSDYRKYALLRALAAGGRVRIGVCWMLTPSDGRSDGAKRAYLEKPAFAKHDPELFALLRQVAGATDSSRLVLIERSGVLPKATFYNAMVPDELERRQGWLAAAMEALQGADLIFFDPDNGLDVPSRPKGRKGSSKFLYRDEVAATFAAGHSVLIYQHFPFEARAAFLARILGDLQRVAPDAELWAFQTAHVAFLLMIQREHQTLLKPTALAAQGTAHEQMFRSVFQHLADAVEGHPVPA